jgi:hypothetical protein
LAKKNKKKKISSTIQLLFDFFNPMLKEPKQPLKVKWAAVVKSQATGLSRDNALNLVGKKTGGAGSPRILTYTRN